MKVYLLFTLDHDGQTLLKVFSSKELAENAKSAMIQKKVQAHFEQCSKYDSEPKDSWPEDIRQEWFKEVKDKIFLEIECWEVEE